MPDASALGLLWLRTRGRCSEDAFWVTGGCPDFCILSAGCPLPCSHASLRQHSE